MYALTLARRRLATFVCVAIAALLLLATPHMSLAQKESVKPGINKPFENPEVGTFVERFEKEGRDVYDKRHEIVKVCDIKKGMVIADIGAGTGLHTRLFAAEVGRSGHVYAVDIAAKFVDHVVKTAREQKLTNVVGVVCKPESAELPPESADMAFICDTYHHFEYPEATMQSVASALRPGGILYLIDFERVEGVSSDWILNHVRAGKEVVCKEVKAAGFELIDEVDLFEKSYFLKFRKK